jgi:hypothetical protein
MSSIFELPLQPALLAGLITLTHPEPAQDRWGYPFNATPGVRRAASTFRSGDADGVVRHGIFIIGYDTSADIQTGLGTERYEIVSARLTLMTSSNFQVVYDPTDDSVYSYLPEDHPLWVEDTDAGRPLELFGAGFRNGETPLTWTEMVPYSPDEGERTVYPVTWDASGEVIDASMNVNIAAPYEARPFAVGQIDGAVAGDNLPWDAPVVFDVDLSQPGVVKYLQNALNMGALYFTATSLHGGGLGARSFPEYHTRDSLVGDPPKLEMTVRVLEAVTEPELMVSWIYQVGGSVFLRFPIVEGREYGIRWSTNLLNWELINDPVLTFPEPGIGQWEHGVEGDYRFYQVFQKD